MRSPAKLLAGIIILLLGAGLLFWLIPQDEPVKEPAPEPVVETPAPAPTTTVSTIGSSVEGRVIESYVIGEGDTDLLFVGGIHGGYEWNSVILAYEMIDYFNANPEEIPDNISLHIVPNLNPDGLYLATGLEGRFTTSDISSYKMHETGTGRFNANGVDLNRNFDCRWEPESTWRSRTVSAGEAPFSEPEAVAIRDYVAQIDPHAAIVWHSRANNVYGSECGGPVTEDTLDLMRTYARAAGYGEVPIFDAYVVTGAIEDWLASQNIPTISVEKETRTSSEFDRNLAGVKAVLSDYGK